MTDEMRKYGRYVHVSEKSEAILLWSSACADMTFDHTSEDSYRSCDREVAEIT